MFDILQGFVLTRFTKRIVCDLLNERNAIFEKVVDNEELIEYIRRDLVILQRRS